MPPPGGHPRPRPPPSGPAPRGPGARRAVSNSGKGASAFPAGVSRRRGTPRAAGSRRGAIMARGAGRFAGRCQLSGAARGAIPPAPRPVQTAKGRPRSQIRGPGAAAAVHAAGGHGKTQ
jgi:hypothetical protein